MSRPGEQLLLGGHGLASRTSASVEAELRQRLKGYKGALWQIENWASGIAEWACPALEADQRCSRPVHCTLLGCNRHEKRHGKPFAAAVLREGQP